jgi:hypothetical protein
MHATAKLTVFPNLLPCTVLLFTKQGGSDGWTDEYFNVTHMKISHVVGEEVWLPSNDYL